MTPVILLGAYITDMIIGDPRWFPHPVVIIGRFARFMEDRVCRSSHFGEKVGGVILWFAVVTTTFFVTWGIAKASFSINFLFGAIVTVLLAAFTLATRSLFDESRVVIAALNSGNIVKAREKLSMIVGRDTKDLDENAILRAVIETVSENLSDGIVAPMFYLTIGGVPLAMTYKAANTLDSMVGYKNDLYRDMGWFSARMDDILNWIPARLTGLIIVAASFILRLDWKNSWKIMRRDGRNHTSPNSGIPEAAMAGSLSIQLGGENTYWGEIVRKPTIGDSIKPGEMVDVKRAWRIMFLSSLIMCLVGACILWMVEI